MPSLNEAWNSSAMMRKPPVEQTQSGGRISKPTANTISAILLSHLGVSSSSSFNSDASSSNGKKKSSSFRGLGCAAGVAEKVFEPAVRSSGEGEERKTMKKKETLCKQKKKTGVGETEKTGGNGESSNSSSINCVKAQDIWCGPGIGFSADDAVIRPEKDCIISRRVVPGGRAKSDHDRFIEKEREKERERGRDRERSRHLERERESERSYRRSAISSNAVAFWESDYPFLAARAEPELHGSRYYSHLDQPSSDELTEVVMLHGGFMVGALLDRFSDWRLDIDEMSYEQLIELSDKIGYVNTGLKEDEISSFIRKIKLSVLNDKSHVALSMKEKKCIICQEEFEQLNDMGKLECGHGFHVHCLKQWLGLKKCCPICKTELQT